MTSLISAKITFPDWKKLGKKVDAEVPQILAATLQTQRAFIFDSEGSYNGRPGWQPLKCRNGMILSDRGQLRRSIAPRNDGNRPSRSVGTILNINRKRVMIGTNLHYAAMQNNGGIIRPVNRKWLRFKCGKEWVFAKQVTIPARPFNDITSQDVSEIKETMQNAIVRILTNGGA